MARIAAIYVPWLSIILDNLNRLTASASKQNDLLNKNSSIGRISDSSSFLNFKETSTEAHKSFHRFTMLLDNTSVRSSMHMRDSSYLAAIAGQGKYFKSQKIKFLIVNINFFSFLFCSFIKWKFIYES